MPTIPLKELLDNAEEITNEPVPKGKYTVTVDEAEWTETAKGKDMLKVVFVIANGPSKGRKLWFNMTISPESPKALGIFFNQLETLGVPQTVVGDLSADEIANRVVGRQALVTVDHREWKGRMQPDVKYVDPVPAGESTAPPSNDDAPPPAAPAEDSNASGDTPPPPPFAS